LATVTLQVIANNEEKDLIRIITDYAKYFDQVQIAIDESSVRHNVQDFLNINTITNVTLFDYGWRNDFSHKRNFLADKCETDYYFTIDCDDSIRYPETIKDVAEQAQKEGYSIVYGYYLYSTDNDGNCIAAHWKERLVKNSPNLRWNKEIHENIVPVSMRGHNFSMDDRLLVKHNADYQHVLRSQERNLAYLLKEYDKDKDKTDPRTIAYLGRVFFGLEQFEMARHFLEKHIALSGWDEDRHLSWCQLSSIFRFQKDYKQAIAAAMEALVEKPDYPEGYLELHSIYLDQGQWGKAIEWGEQGLKKEPPRNFIVTDPSAYTWRPALSLSYCYFSLGEYEKAMTLFQYAKKLAPSVDFIKEHDKVYTEGVEYKRYIDHLIWVLGFTRENGGNVKALVESIPSKMNENSTIANLRNRYLDPKIWPERSVVIYCGETPNTWSPDSVKDGVGGSEEAVIHLSKQLFSLGYDVTVYNSCEKEGTWDGVKYLGSVRFNPKDSFNILISWRTNIFSYGIQACNKIVWIHDLPQMEFTEDTIKSFDKIVVLSKYHASLLPKIVPEEKIYISTNGINPDDFLGLENIKREPHRLIYASSYDRGLEKILDNWPEIRRSVPDAEIHCYYGWNTYLSYLKRGLIKDDGFYDKMQKLFKQDGVFDHGRIGHKELTREYVKASILAYPCTYAGEINCIALTKAIACGCYPITNDFAVMAERNTHGKVVTDDKFIPSLITLLRKGDTKMVTDGYIEQNSWAKVAHDWEQDLFQLDTPTVVRDRIGWTFDQLDPEKTIVDIGSNKGHIFNGWNRDKITSVDIDLYDIPNFVRASADNLPFTDKQFDQALLAEIVEHTKNPVQVLTEARRVAKKVIVTVPYEFEWDSTLDPFEGVAVKSLKPNFEKEVLAVNPAKEMHQDGFAHLFHEVFYTPELLRSHLMLAGFKEFRIEKIRSGKWCWLGAICQD
jgi:tetratricopeptide (TPR) repeat protein